MKTFLALFLIPILAFGQTTKTVTFTTSDGKTGTIASPTTNLHSGSTNQIIDFGTNLSINGTLTISGTATAIGLPSPSINIGTNAFGVLSYASGTLTFVNSVNGASGLAQYNSSANLVAPSGLWEIDYNGILKTDSGSFSTSGTGTVTAVKFIGALSGTATSATTVPWQGVTSTPATLAGYGITNGQTAITFSTGLNLTGTNVTVVYGTSAGTALQGNTAFQTPLTFGPNLLLTGTNVDLKGTTGTGSVVLSSGSTQSNTTLTGTLDLSKVSTPFNNLESLGYNSFAGPACTILDIGDSQTTGNSAVIAQIQSQATGAWLSAMPWSQQSTVYTCGLPGQNGTTISAAFNAGAFTVTNCTTTSGTSTVTSTGSLSSVVNGYSVAGNGIPPNSVVQYSGTGSTMNLFYGTTHLNFGSFYNGGEQTFSCTSGAAFITAATTPIVIVPTVGQTFVGPGIPNNDIINGVSGSNWYLSQATGTVVTSGTGYLGYPAKATASGTSTTLTFTPPVSNGGYTYYAWTGGSRNEIQSFMGTPSQLTVAQSGTVVFLDHGFNHDWADTASAQFSCTVSGSLVTGTGLGSTSAYNGFELWVNDQQAGVVSSVTSGTITLTATSLVPNGTYTAISTPSGGVCVPQLGPLITIMTNMIATQMATGTAGTNRFAAVVTDWPAYQTSPNVNSQAYANGARLDYNARLKAAVAGITGAFIIDAATIPQLQSYSTQYYIPYPDATHLSSAGYQLVAKFEDFGLAINIPSSFLTVPNTRGSFAAAQLPQTVVTTDKSPTFNVPIFVNNAWGNVSFKTYATGGFAVQTASGFNTAGISEGILGPTADLWEGGGTLVLGSVGSIGIPSYYAKLQDNGSLSCSGFSGWTNGGGNYFLGLNVTGDGGHYANTDWANQLENGTGALAFVSIASGTAHASLGAQLTQARMESNGDFEVYGQIRGKAGSSIGSGIGLGLVPTMTSNSTGTITFNSVKNNEVIYNSSGSTITSGTITLSSASVAGQTNTYVSDGIVTSLAITGGTVIGTPPTSLAANSAVKLQCTATGTWVYIP